MNQEKAKALRNSIKEINKRFGAGTVMTAFEAAQSGVLAKKVIPTPSLELNDALHCGGFSAIVELYGTHSSGKTSLAIDTIVQAQKNDPDFVGAWLETEGSITEDILKDHGVDFDRFVFWRQEAVGNAENALDVARGLISSGGIDMMVVNSVAGLAPKVETQDDLEKQNIALTARLMSKFFRVANGITSKNNITMVFINQVRDNVGQMFGDTSTTTGGRALSFYASQRIKMNRLKIQSADPITEEEGVKISCIIHKNRFAGRHNPFTKCFYYAKYDSGIDKIIPMPQFLVNAGILTQSGSWYTAKDSNGNVREIKGTPIKFNSKGALIEALRTNHDIYEFLAAELAFKHSGSAEIQTQDEIAEVEAENNAIDSSMSSFEREEAINDINESFDKQQ